MVDFPTGAIPIEVECMEIVKTESKMYAYRLHVAWADGKTSMIQRKYSDVFDLRTQLKALHKDNKTVVVPSLPGQKWFHMLGSQEKRKKQATEFFNLVLLLQENMKNNEKVEAFFQPTHDDNQLQQSLKSQQKSVEARLSLANDRKISAGTTIAEQAARAARKISEPARPPNWTPSRDHDSENIIEQYIMNTDYQGEDENILNLTRGQIVEIVEKGEDGWWFICAESVEDEVEGWVPAAFLEPIEQIAPLPPRSSHSNVDDFCDEPLYEVISDYKKSKDDELNCSKGEKVKVLSKCKDGWWQVTVKDKIGFVPALHLAAKRSPNQPAPKENALKSVYKKILPPRRNISEKELGELYADVLPRHLRAKKQAAATSHLLYTQVDFNSDVVPVIPEIAKQSPVIYSTINPGALPPKASKASENYDDVDGEEDDHVYKNLKVDATSRNYENTVIIQQSKLQESDTSVGQFFTVTGTATEPFNHSPALEVPNCTIVKCLKSEGDLRFALVCSKVSNGKDVPPMKEGWIHRKRLKSIDVDVIKESGQNGLPIVHPKPKPRTTVPGVVPPVKTKKPTVQSPPVPTKPSTSIPPIPLGPTKPSKPTAEVKPGHKLEKETKDQGTSESEVNQARPWLAGELSREKCEEIIADAENGQFIIRGSPKVDQFILSVKWRKEIKHFKIKASPTGNFSLGQKDFESFEEIIAHYQKSELFVTDTGEKVCLGKAFEISLKGTDC